MILVKMICFSLSEVIRLWDKRQRAVNENLHCVNSKRVSSDYQSEHTLKKKHEWPKLGACWDGLYEIGQVCEWQYDRGISRGSGRWLIILRTKPYKSWSQLKIEEKSGMPWTTPDTQLILLLISIYLFSAWSRNWYTSTYEWPLGSFGDISDTDRYYSRNII